MKPSTDEILERLRRVFPDDPIEVIDDSHHHIGHAGAAGGAGHFTVRIASARFAGIRTVARHRLVYDALLDWMPHRIHALAIDARVPGDAVAARPEGDA
ncbi:MAG: BolA family protein [Burkholderiaceae bacterium]